MDITIEWRETEGAYIVSNRHDEFLADYEELYAACEFALAVAEAAGIGQQVILMGVKP